MPPPAPPAPAVPAQTAALPWLRHSWILAGRAAKKMIRHPEQFFDVTLQPALFLVIFVYMLRWRDRRLARTTTCSSCCRASSIQTIAMFSTVTIGVNLNTDVEKGVFDRFRSLPIARSAPLIGAVLARRRCAYEAVTISISSRYRLPDGLPHRRRPAAGDRWPPACAAAVRAGA